jgi:hypothetical protein
MSTNTKSTNTTPATNPAIIAPVNPSAPGPHGTGGWAGSLWSLLSELEALNSDIQQDFIETETNNISMQTDEGIAAAKAQYDMGINNAKATLADGIASIAGGTLTLATAAYAGCQAKWGTGAMKADELEKELEQLKKIDKDHFLTPKNDDLVAGENAATQWNKNSPIGKRTQELIDGPNRFFQTQLKNGNELMTKEELALFDENPNNNPFGKTSIYDHMGPDRRAQVKPNLDKAISQKQIELETARKQVNDNLTGIQMASQCATALSSGVGAMVKQGYQRDAAQNQQDATRHQTEQQLAQQGASSLKSFMDKAADSGSGAVQQITAAIQTSLRA